MQERGRGQVKKEEDGERNWMTGEKEGEREKEQKDLEKRIRTAKNR